MGLEEKSEGGSGLGPTASAPSIKVFMPHERPIRVYRGDGDDVEAFIRETELSIKTRSLEHPEDIDLVKSYLEGDARREVALRETYTNVAEVYDVLREAFGDTRTVQQLLRSFYDRSQRPGETIRHFSHNLDSLARTIHSRQADALPHIENSKRNQFVEGLMDVSLRQNLKRMIRENPELTFLSARKEACLWAEESDAAGSCQTVRTSTQHDPMMMEMVNSLTEQMTKLAAAVADFKAERTNGSQPPTAPPTAPPQHTTPTEAQGYRQCWTCGQHGHVQRYCPHRPQQRQYQRQYQRPSGNANPQLPGPSN